MGQIHQIGDQFYIEFYARGLMYSQLGGNSQEDARKLLESIESKIAAGEALTQVRDIDIIIFVDNFCRFIKQENSLKTANRFESFTTHFHSFLTKQHPTVIKLSQVTPVIVASYKTFLISTVKPKMVNFSLLLLREMLEYGIKTGFINDNPTWHISLVKWPNAKVRNSTQYTDIQTLLAKGVSFFKVYQLMKFDDVAQMLYFSNLIPLTRQDMYN